MDPLRPGDTLDTFTIEKELHSSAMAKLYQATDILTDETIVLKVPFGDILNNPIQYYHYQNEERIGRALDHPNIVRFFNRDRSCQYIIMEYVQGRDLRSKVGKGKQMEFSKARHIVLQIIDAFTYLHDRGTIHLDLKPENIIIIPPDKVKIIDFGFASQKGLPDLLAEDFSLPHGTPNYIAPEQIVGYRREKRSDIYSLGILLYEMLTGQLPYPSSTKLSETRRRLKIDPVPPRYHDPAIEPQLQEIILKCLQRQPEKRYNSAVALKEDLQNYRSLPVTDRGLNRKKPSRFFAFFSPTPSFPQAPETANQITEHDQFHILGAIIDHDNSNLVVEEIRKRALIHAAHVTLLSVIEEEDDSHLRKYGLAVEGERFRTRLERYVRRFRRFNIDPTIRLISGNAAETIISVAGKIKADLILLGPSRKSGLFVDSTVKKVSSFCSAEVVVAGPNKPEFPWSMKGVTLEKLTEEQVLDIDLFLVDTWYQHVSWLVDIALGLLTGSHQKTDLDPQHCFVGKWLAEIHSNPFWVPIAELIEPVHYDIHDMAEEMASCADSRGLQCMKQIYQESVLPLSCALRDQFIEASRLVRIRSGHQNSKRQPVLANNACPIFNQELPSGGPLLQLHTIKNYLDSRGNENSSRTPALEQNSTSKHPGRG